MKERPISTTRLAQICGVSQGTVDRALNDRKGISPKTKEKILRVAREYGYRPNIHARSMAGGRSMLIGVVVFHLYNQYFSDILTALERALTARGYAIVVMLTNKDPQREIECLRSLYHMSVDGIVLCPINQGPEFENFLLSLEIPVVTIGNRLQQLPHVGIDDSAAMAQAADYVLRKGYDHLVYVMPSVAYNSTAQAARLEGFLDTVKHRSCSFCTACAEEAAAHLRPDRRNAIVCPSDYYALKLLPLASAQGTGIISFDNLHLLTQLQIPLDSMSYDLDRAAGYLTDFLIDAAPIPGPVPHELVIRGSV